jgi:PIN domain nuclease of toxin-antitoxin system
LKLLLDTAYFLPAIGISIKELPNDAPIKLIAKGHQISISDISIFELSAKGVKHITNGTLTPERVTRGIKAIIYDDTIETIPIIHGNNLLLTSFKLKSILNDFIDCLILSSAINQCDALITEDSDIQNLKKNKEFNELQKTTNTTFKIQKLTEIL